MGKQAGTAVHKDLKDMHLFTVGLVEAHWDNNKKLMLVVHLFL